jgi:hypothetical protein
MESGLNTNNRVTAIIYGSLGMIIGFAPAIAFAGDSGSDAFTDWGPYYEMIARLVEKFIALV